MNSEEYYIISLALHNSISADLINSLLCCLSETLDKLRVDVYQAIFDPVDELLDIFGMPTRRPSPSRQPKSPLLVALLADFMGCQPSPRNGCLLCEGVRQPLSRNGNSLGQAKTRN